MARHKTFQQSQFHLQSPASSEDFFDNENMGMFYAAHILAGMKARKTARPAPVTKTYYNAGRNYSKDPLEFTLSGRTAKSKAKPTTTLATSSPRAKAIPRAPRENSAVKKVTPKKPKPKAVGRQVDRLDWRSVEDVCPPIDTLDGKTWAEVGPTEANNAQYTRKDYSDDVDYKHLHPREQDLILRLGVSPDKYLHTKRRVFLKFVEIKTENPNTNFTRTLAQSVKGLDANKLSIVHQLFDNANWYHPKYYPQIDWHRV